MSNEEENASRYHIEDVASLEENNSHSIILKFLQDHSPVLDVGCSTGFLGRYLKSKGIKAVGVEVDAAAAEKAALYYEKVIVGDISSSHTLEQLEDKSFGAIVLGDVIEHLTDPWNFVKEISKKLSDNGDMIISIPHLGHAGAIASLLSGSFEYREEGILDRSHYRFFGLRSFCALLLDAGLTPIALERVTHDVFSTELPIDTDSLPAELFSVLDRCPESRTYQFVMKARKSPSAESLSHYVREFSLPMNEAKDSEKDLQRYLGDLEVKRKDLREAREYIATCLHDIAEKKSIIRKVTSENLSLKRMAGQGTDRCEWVESAIAGRIQEIHSKLGTAKETRPAEHSGDNAYDILIPIFNAFDHVGRCVESVLKYTGPEYLIYLLDDASTDERIMPLLKSFAEKDSRVRVIPSEKNAGFVANINRGFHVSRNDVVILNSDTEVTECWLDGLRRCAASDRSIGIVCPLSNNATILSVPEMNISNKLPVGLEVSAFAKIVAETSLKTYPRIPTAVGFCMLITRETLELVGDFDLAFSPGYGEENDFSLRARKLGIGIACCDDTYVHHYGEASFCTLGQIKEHRRKNALLLAERWPEYNDEVLAFCRANPLRDIQERIYHRLLSLTRERRPSVLHVIHSFGALGGTELHTRNIIDGLCPHFRSTVIFPQSQPEIWSDMSSTEITEQLRIVGMVKEGIRAKDSFSGFAGDLRDDGVEDTFARFISGGDYDIVHFQHLIDWNSLMLPFIAKSFGKKVIISLHDYFLLCPEYNLLLPGLQKRCGKTRADGGEAKCVYCLGAKRFSRADNPAPVGDYLDQRFQCIRQMAEIADVFIAPSSFVRDRFIEAFGDLVREKIVVIPHGVEPMEKSPRPERTRRLRVGFLGNASDRKGIFIFLQAASILKDKEVRFEIFGRIPPNLRGSISDLGIITHGEYRRGELRKLLSAIDLVIVPSVWDETFCLTVTESQAMGIPVLAADAGAISERIEEGVTGFLFPAGNSKALASRIQDIASRKELINSVLNGLESLTLKSMQENIEDYGRLYRRLLQQCPSPKSENGNEAVKKPDCANGVIRKDLVSIVVLAFNELRYTKECVDSVRKHTPERHEIIFVDNGSKDGTVKWLRKIVGENANYTLIENAVNMGFAKGCNQGMRAASGEFILLLNNDTVVTEGWLSGMLACLRNDPMGGIIGPMTNSVSGVQKDIFADYGEVSGLEQYAKAFRLKNSHRRVPVRRVVGFCMLFRRELTDEIGLLDENFGSGNFEDDDLCLRAVLNGRRNYIAGDVFIHHYGSRSFIGNRIAYDHAMLANRKVISQKWNGLDRTSETGKRFQMRKATEKAEVSHHKGMIPEAIDAFLKALKYAPDDINLYLSLAAMLFDEKRFKDALDVLKEAPSQEEDGRLAAWYGYCYEGADEVEESERFADKSLLLLKDNPPALNLKGMLAYKKGDRAAAEKFFSEAISGDPSYGEPHTNLAVTAWADGFREKALSLAERGFVLSPLIGDIANIYHSIVSAEGEYQRAERTFREAKCLHPLNRRITFLLIDILIRQEKNEEAIREIEEAMTVFGIDDGLISAALDIRRRIGPLESRRPGKSRGSLSLCMIVKNEEGSLATCLRSVSGLVDEIIVVDTGSTDRTKGIAEIFGAKVFDFEWTGDFSAARNFSLSQASGDWILVLDADEALSPQEHASLIALLKNHGNSAAYSFNTRNYVNDMTTTGWTANEGRYAEEIGRGWFPSEKVRLFTNDERIRFENPVHELVEASLKSAHIKVKKCGVPIHHYGKYHTEKVLRKGEDYYLLGKRKLEEKNGDIQALFELAVQAAELKRYDEAAELWQTLIASKKAPDAFLARAYLNLSGAYLEQGRYEEALSAAEKALGIDHGLKGAVINCALAAFCTGNLKLVAKLLENLLSKDSGYFPALALLFASYAIAGDKEKSRRYMLKVRESGADCSPYVSEYARKLLAANRVEPAVLLLNEAIEHDVVSKDILELLSQCTARVGTPARNY